MYFFVVFLDFFNIFVDMFNFGGEVKGSLWIFLGFFFLVSSLILECFFFVFLFISIGFKEEDVLVFKLGDILVLVVIFDLSCLNILGFLGCLRIFGNLMWFCLGVFKFFMILCFL